MRTLVPVALLAAAAGGAVYACLPADDRPPPASLTVTVSPSPKTLGGFDTSDGWSVRFDRVLMGFGGASLSDTCTAYSEANYDRIFDLGSDAPQKVSTLYAIGECDMRFRVGVPSSDALLGERVDDADKTRMRTPGSDPYLPIGGISLEVSGTGKKAGVQKTFHFTFRPRVRFDRCGIEVDGGVADAGSSVSLKSGEVQQANVRIEAESLFRDSTNANLSHFRFDPFAAADTNGDGEITLDELRLLPVSALTDAGPFDTTLNSSEDTPDATVDRPGRTVRIESVGDFMYIMLMPLLPRLRDTLRCRSSVQLPRADAGR
ncbi:MAG: hypothetical protein HOO96_30540 [Polyangiaceae bacterium]|nr:hypothetical protein [Polyangiaceae bacterium]